MDAKQAFDQINAGNNNVIDVPYDLIANKQEYKGTIHFRFPSVRDEIFIGIEEAKLRGTLVEFGGRPELITVSNDSLDNYTRFLVEGLATLKVLAITEDKSQFERLPQELIIEIHRGYLRIKNSDGEVTAEPDTTNTELPPSDTTEQSS